MPSPHVALLRGINVGGKHKLPMKDLVAMFAQAGCGDVRSYIQSGNIIFTAAPDLSSRLSGMITAQIQKRFGFEAPVVLRTAAQLAKVITNNPFIQTGVAEEQLHVMFLAGPPDSASVRRLDPARSAPDEFLVRGQEIYLRFPHGMGRSKLTTQYFDSILSTLSTVRNWRTATKLLELMQA
jgi:uncharacterized protein (DUF1697 family)